MRPIGALRRAKTPSKLQIDPMSPILKKKPVMNSPRRTFIAKVKEDKGLNLLISAKLPTQYTKLQPNWENSPGLQRRKPIKNFIILSQSYPLA